LTASCGVFLDGLQADLDRFRNELLLLSAINHPNVVSLIGAKALPPDYMLVLRLGAHNLRHMLYEMAWRPPWEVVIRWDQGSKTSSCSYQRYLISQRPPLRL